MRCPKCHAHFWVIPKSAASCTDERPFGFDTIRKTSPLHAEGGENRV